MYNLPNIVLRRWNFYIIKEKNKKIFIEKKKGKKKNRGSTKYYEH